MARALLLFTCLLGLTATVSAQEAASSEEAQEVRELQAALIFLGYSIDAINGIYGPQTTRAVEAFEFSVGMGDEGVLGEGELALLAAQVTAHSYERFGYRLQGRWQVGDCAPELAAQSLWFEDLVWIADAQTRFSLIQTELSEPLVVTWQDQDLSISTPYLSVVNTGADVRFFPLEDRLLALVGDDVFMLQQCEDSLIGPGALAQARPLFTASPAEATDQ